MDSLKCTIVKSLVNTVRTLEKEIKNAKIEFGKQTEIKLSSNEDYADTLNSIIDSFDIKVYGCKISHSDCIISNESIIIDLTSEKWKKVAEFLNKLKKFYNDNFKYFYDEHNHHKIFTIDCSSVIEYLSEKELCDLYCAIMKDPTKVRVRNNNLEILYTYRTIMYGLTLGDLFVRYNYNHPENQLSKEQFEEKVKKTFGVNFNLQSISYYR